MYTCDEKNIIPVDKVYGARNCNRFQSFVLHKHLINILISTIIF